MKLTQQEVQLFYKLYLELLHYTNKEKKIAYGITEPEDLRLVPFEVLESLKNTLFANPALIDAFVKANPAQFSAEELAIIKNWKNYVSGNFLLVEHLPEHAVFLKDEPPQAFGVLALEEPFEKILGPATPVLLHAVLLPFKNHIIYDGILTPHTVAFTSDHLRKIEALYKAAQAAEGIVVSLT